MRERNVGLAGSVYDGFMGMPLKAKIFLYDQDSTLIDTVSCVIRDRTSTYSFKTTVKTGHRYLLKCVMPGYGNSWQKVDVEIPRREDCFVVPKFLLKKSLRGTVNLDEVVVRGTRIQMTFRGDTIIYDAAAFNLPEGSMLESLIRQLPGAELKANGDIFVNGNKVDFLTLNGALFFKDKSNYLLENLPYFTVKDIKVYHRDRSNPNDGFRGKSQKDYVMDVRLKREYLHSSLYNGEVGLGTNNRWMGRIFGLWMGDFTDAIAFGNLNNTNENRKPGLDGKWTPSSVPHGVGTTKQVGVSMETHDKENSWTDDLSSTVEWRSDNIERRSASTLFSSDGDISKGSTSCSKTDNFHVDLSNENHFHHKISGSSMFNFEYNKGNTTSLAQDSTYRDHLVNQTKLATQAHHQSLQLFSLIDIDKKLASEDHIGITFDGSYGFTKPDEDHSLRDIKYSDVEESTQNLFRKSKKQDYRFGTEISYYYNLPHQWDFISSVKYSQDYASRENYYYQLDRLSDPAYDDIGVLPSMDEDWTKSFDLANSQHYNTLSRAVVGDVCLQQMLANQYIYIGFPLKIARDKIHYFSNATDTVAHRTLYSFEPTIEYKMFGENKRLLTYSLHVTPPSFAALMPYCNNVNPLSIRINNQKLKSQISQHFEGNMNFHPKSKTMNYWLGGVFNYAHNAWGTRTTYDRSTGRFTYMSDNISEGNWNASVKGGFFSYLDKKKQLTLDFSGNLAYYHSVDFDIAYDAETTEKSRVRTFIPDMNAKLNYRFNSSTIGINVGGTYRCSRSNKVVFTNINAKDYQMGCSYTGTLPIWKLSLATDINLYCRRGYSSAEMNTNNWVWNAQLTHPLFRGKIVVGLKAFDILHQLSNKSYAINAQGHTETWYNSIPRYLMFNVSFNFTKKNK